MELCTQVWADKPCSLPHQSIPNARAMEAVNYFFFYDELNLEGCPHQPGEDEVREFQAHLSNRISKQDQCSALRKSAFHDRFLR